MLLESQFLRNHRPPRRQLLDYLIAAGAVAVAGVAFLSSFFAALLVAGFLASSLTTAGASALVTAGVATGAGAVGLACSAAKAVTANRVIRVAISDFILISFGLSLYRKLFPAYIYNATARNYVDTVTSFLDKLHDPSP